MRSIELGHTGVEVSALGLGCMYFGSAIDERRSFELLDRYLDAGGSHLDTANNYAHWIPGSEGGESERVLGRWMRARRNRDQLFVATKVGFNMPPRVPTSLSRQTIVEQCENSLRQLQTDHIDLYYVHRWDPTTPIEETLRGLDDLICAGKIRYLGVSGFAAWQLAQAHLLAEVRGWAPITAIQSEYNMLERAVEHEVLPCCEALGVGFVPYRPLAGGFLTGKYRRGEPAPPGSRGETSESVQRYMRDVFYDKIERLEAWAAERGRGLNELAQAWLLAQPQVCSVISGVTSVDHLVSNADAAGWELSDENLDAVDAIVAG